MASVYTNDLRLEEIGSGEQSGSWGDTTNTNLELIAEAFAFGTEAITTNADTHATTIADGATDPGRAMFLKYTGTLDSACTITIGPNTVSKLWFIENGTSGSQNIIIKQGSGATITIPPGDTKAIYSNGAGSGGAMVDAFASLSVVDLNVSGNLDVDGTANLDVVDIDGAVNMATTALVTGVLTTTAATVFNGGFAANAVSTITTADNAAQLSLISTDTDASSGPRFDMYRNPGEAGADSDNIGQVNFFGLNDASEKTQFVYLATEINDAANGSEDSRFTIGALVAGADSSIIEYTQDTPATGADPEIVFNNTSRDINFRVESDGNANMLFVDGGNNRVGIGTSAPGTNLQVNGDGLQVRLDGTADTSRGIMLRNTGSAEGQIQTDGNMHFIQEDSGKYMRFSTANTERMRIDSSGNVNVGVPTADTSLNFISVTGGLAGSQLNAQMRFFGKSVSNTGVTYETARISGGSTSGSVSLSGGLVFSTSLNNGSNVLTLAEKMRIDDTGNLLVGKTATGIGTAGIQAEASGQLNVTKVGDAVIRANRLTNDGTVISIRQANTEEGTISVSGSTVSYNAFSGSHWSRLTDNSEPTILKGTLIETIDEMCDWYQAQFTVLATTKVNEEGDTVEDVAAYTLKESIALPDGASVGDTISHISNDVTYSATIVKENDNKHPKCKISNTADSVRIYGVFAAWDSDEDTVNDMYVTAVGTHVVRVHGGQTVSAGDLLVSNGDGTAKVQDDDIIRSKTLGKVLTNIKQETYADNSYTVPCALYCG